MAGTMKGLSQAARVTLLTMALNAHDVDEKGTLAYCYFRGWNHLGRMLGYEPAGPDERLSKAAEQAVTRAIRELTKAGLIEAIGHINGRSSPMVYRLTL